MLNNLNLSSLEERDNSLKSVMMYKILHNFVQVESRAHQPNSNQLKATLSIVIYPISMAILWLARFDGRIEFQGKYI